MIETDTEGVSGAVGEVVPPAVVGTALVAVAVPTSPDLVTDAAIGVDDVADRAPAVGLFITDLRLVTVAVEGQLAARVAVIGPQVAAVGMSPRGCHHGNDDRRRHDTSGPEHALDTHQISCPSQTMTQRWRADAIHRPHLPPALPLLDGTD